MGLYVIGKMFNEKGKCIAYKIYSDETKQHCLIAKEDVLEQMINGHKVTGLRLADQAYPTKYSVNTATRLKEQTGAYRTAKLDRVDCRGNVIGDPQVYIVMGVYGFGENRQFVCINGNCEEKVFAYKEFTERLKNGGIIGATQIDDSIYLYKTCRKQLYN